MVMFPQISTLAAPIRFGSASPAEQTETPPPITQTGTDTYTQTSFDKDAFCLALADLYLYPDDTKPKAIASMIPGDLTTQMAMMGFIKLSQEIIRRVNNNYDYIPDSEFRPRMDKLAKLSLPLMERGALSSVVSTLSSLSHKEDVYQSIALNLAPLLPDTSERDNHLIKLINTLSDPQKGYSIRYMAAGFISEIDDAAKRLQVGKKLLKMKPTKFNTECALAVRNQFDDKYGLFGWSSRKNHFNRWIKPNMPDYETLRNEANIFSN